MVTVVRRAEVGALTPDEVVSALCDSWERCKPDEQAEYFADDAVFQNMPMPPVMGKEAIREAFRRFIGALDGLSVVIHKQVSSGSVVMNERTDRKSVV